MTGRGRAHKPFTSSGSPCFPQCSFVLCWHCKIDVFPHAYLVYSAAQPGGGHHFSEQLLKRVLLGRNDTASANTGRAPLRALRILCMEDEVFGEGQGGKTPEWSETERMVREVKVAVKTFGARNAKVGLMTPLPPSLIRSFLGAAQDDLVGYIKQSISPCPEMKSSSPIYLHSSHPSPSLSGVTSTQSTHQPTSTILDLQCHRTTPKGQSARVQHRRARRLRQVHTPFNSHPPVSIILSRVVVSLLQNSMMMEISDTHQRAIV